MSKATVAQLFGSLRSLNSAWEIALAQIRSTMGQLQRTEPSRLPEHHVDYDDDTDTINGSAEATVVLAVQRRDASQAVSFSPERGGGPVPSMPHNPVRTTSVRARRGDDTKLPWQSQPWPSSAPATPARPAQRSVADGRRERERVQEQQLSPTMQTWIAEYSQYGPRKVYLWKWCAQGVDLTTLPSVDASLREHLRDTKLLSIMVNVLLDDIADRREPGALLDVLTSITRGGSPDLSGLSEHDRAYAEFTTRVWQEYWRRAREYPCFAAFERLLAYDLQQLFNAIEYSALLNQQVGLINVVEHDLYSPHNMMMMSFATLDLACSPAFQLTELGKLREAVWHAQWMGRIGNLLSTWHREAAVGDFTSGVFARAVALGELSVEQLQSANPQQIESAINEKEHFDFYRRRWNYHRQCLKAKAGEVRSIAMEEVIEGHDRFFAMHLGSTGLI